MTRVCLVGAPDVNLRYELLSRETSRRALQTHDLREPYENTLGLETVSLGGAVSLLNDLNWYIVRFVDEALVLEPSISDEEWLSRDLASAVRDDDLSPAETGRLLKVYGIDSLEKDGTEPDRSNGADSQQQDDTDAAPTTGSGETVDEAEPSPSDGAVDTGLPRLVEPMLVTRTGETIPEYDIRDVADTLVVRVTEAEFENR